MPSSGNSNEVGISTSDGAVVRRTNDRLLQQYKDATAPGVKEIVDAFGWEVQNLADAISTFDDLLPPGAAGVQLDRLGKLIGEPRNGRTDSAYLPWILAKIRANRSSGSIEDIIGVFVALIGSTVPGQVQVQEFYPAAILVTVLAILAGDDPVQAAALLRLAKKAGVGAQLLYIGTDTAHTFSFKDGPGLGFGAGKFASVRGA